MSKTLNDLRDVLFQTLQAVKDGTLDLDKARAINELGKTLTDSARVEVDYIRAVGGKVNSPFIQNQALPAGITGVTRHQLGE